MRIQSDLGISTTFDCARRDAAAVTATLLAITATDTFLTIPADPEPVRHGKYVIHPANPELASIQLGGQDQRSLEILASLHEYLVAVGELCVLDSVIVAVDPNNPRGAVVNVLGNHRLGRTAIAPLVEDLKDALAPEVELSVATVTRREATAAAADVVANWTEPYGVRF
jgi:hypothetical protein